MNRYRLDYYVKQVEYGSTTVLSEDFETAYRDSKAWLDYYSHGQNYEILSLSVVDIGIED